MPMPKRNYRQEYKTQVARGEHEDRMERQRARRELDKKGVSRDGKDVAHTSKTKTISQSQSKNRADKKRKFFK